MVEASSGSVQVADGLIISKISKPADSSQTVQPGQEVSIAYTLSRKKDPLTVVASATADSPYKFILGANQVILGFELAVSHLSVVGSKALLDVRSDLAYGKVGQPPDILDNDDLLIQVEILSQKAIDANSIALMNDEQKF